MVWEKYYRIHSKMTYSQKSNVFGPLSLPLCHNLSRFSVSSFTCHHRRRDKCFFRKANFKIHFGTYTYIWILWAKSHVIIKTKYMTNLFCFLLLNWNSIFDLFIFLAICLSLWCEASSPVFFRKYTFLRNWLKTRETLETVV